MTSKDKGDDTTTSDLFFAKYKTALERKSCEDGERLSAPEVQQFFALNNSYSQQIQERIDKENYENELLELQLFKLIIDKCPNLFPSNAKDQLLLNMSYLSSKSLFFHDEILPLKFPVKKTL